MTIPEKPLELDIDPNALTLDEMALFSQKGFNFYDFRQFLIDHVTSWTAEEIGRITVGELEQLAGMIEAKVQEISVPLASSPRSKNGRGSKATASRPGRSATSTPKNTAATRKTSPEP